ncbi:uncharacterized protein IL334_005751 [Kwoniella shivajii]|uniref:Zn(2)-C6 fungal-type domain-containing protein n=1 Tax=Kwoniella shivajii TaxID=564305 RepID=A0ABZ1D402_9TREE|nr:hypothetical protein IL334_005751 [Kwoniella shivajii]
MQQQSDIRKRAHQQQDSQDQDEDDDTPKRRLGKVDRGREACNECRRHKIRCHPHADDPQHLFPCSRCERMNLACEFAKHNRGRKRKRPLPLLAGTSFPEDAAAQQNAGPSSGSKSTYLESGTDGTTQLRSFGDPRFPFISNETDLKPKSNQHYRSIEKEDVYRPSRQMSLRHMVGEDTSQSEESSDEDEQDQVKENNFSAMRDSGTGRDHGAGSNPGVVAGKGESHPNKKSSAKGKSVPTRGPELVDDPIRAGFVDEGEARALFHLYMTHYNSSMPLLDPTLHTHDFVREQSSFLYTSILCVTSRYLSSLTPHTGDGSTISPESAQSVHQQILVLARDHMTWAFAEAIASIDVVRAMVILGLNKEPEDDKAGYHISRAVLLGKELNLGCILTVEEMNKLTEEEQRRLRSRQRVWLCLFFANSIFNMQFQQPMLIQQSDPLIATAHHWLKRARPDMILRDTQLVCSIELRRKYLHYRDLLVGSGPVEASYRSALSLSLLTKTMNQDWDVCSEAWIRDIIDVGGTSSHVNKPRVWTASLRLNLNLLIVNQTLRLPPQDQIDLGSPSSIPAFHHCLNAATTVLMRIESLDRTQLTFASDTFLHFALYAATLLSTLCRGQHPYKFETHEVDHCRRLITKVADALDAASAYASDSPTLHAWYLRRLCQLLPPPSSSNNMVMPTGLSISAPTTDQTLPPATANPPIDPVLQNVTTNMPVDPALTSGLSNELDFFLSDFPWVGLNLDTPIAAVPQQGNNQWNGGDVQNLFADIGDHSLNGYQTNGNNNQIPMEMPYGMGIGMGGMGIGSGSHLGGMNFGNVMQ